MQTGVHRFLRRNCQRFSDDGEPWCVHQAGLEARGADKMLVCVLRLISFGASIADGLDGAVDLRLTERELVL